MAGCESGFRIICNRDSLTLALSRYRRRALESISSANWDPWNLQKAVFEIIAPVSGTMTAVNAAVVDDPGLANSGPYRAEWLVELELENLEQDRELLLDGAAYAKTVKRKAAEP